MELSKPKSIAFISIEVAIITVFALIVIFLNLDFFTKLILFGILYVQVAVELIVCNKKLKYHKKISIRFSTALNYILSAAMLFAICVSKISSIVLPNEIASAYVLIFTYLYCKAVLNGKKSLQFKLSRLTSEGACTFSMFVCAVGIFLGLLGYLT